MYNIRGPPRSTYEQKSRRAEEPSPRYKLLMLVLMA